LLDDLVRRDGLRHYHVTVFGEEPHGCYNRILLSRVLAGAAADDIMLKPPEWYAERGVRFPAGAAVATLAAAGRQLHTARGQTTPYDTAVFATGSVPFVPNIGGLKRPDGRPKEGVFLFRTVEDCQRIRAYTRPAGNAIVIGGGLLGLEAAKGLCDLGLHVTVIHLFDTLMNTQVDKFGGGVVRRGGREGGPPLPPRPLPNRNPAGAPPPRPV